MLPSQNTSEYHPKCVWAEQSMGNVFHARHTQSPINGIHCFKSTSQISALVDSIALSERVTDLPGAPQVEVRLKKKFET